MNQSTPPNNPYEQDGTSIPEAGTESNPYLRQHGSAASPDLNAAAPSLRVEEQQRVNRKALMFLAGIVGLLVLLAIFVLGNSSQDEEAAPELRDVANAPEAPGAPQLPIIDSGEPIPVQSYDDGSGAGLPPLPPEPSQSTYPSADYGSSAPGPAAPAAPRPPTLAERRMGMVDPADVGSSAGLDATVSGDGMNGPPGATGQAAGAGAAGRDGPSSARFLRNPNALLVRGTYLRCVLETRIITDVPGFTSCIVTEPVYSINGRSLLLPRGSKISGRYQEEPSGPRVAVVWDRITTPNGVDVNMSSPGIDNLGGAGHPGHYTNHWPSKIASALMISLVADAFKYAAAENGPPTTSVGEGVIVQNPYESVTARSMERMANEAISKNLRRPATVTINQGTVVNVYVARDVDFSGVIARR